MPTPKAWTHNAQRPLKALDEFDLTAFNPRTVRAILYPESASADYSLQLSENGAKLASI